jgi:hypothetical protein
MGDQHAVEGIPMLPLQRARRLGVSSVNREFEEPGRKRRGARRSLELDLSEIAISQNEIALT